MEDWWTARLNQTYKHPDIVGQDVNSVLSVFTDLRPGVDTCDLGDGTQKQLLILSGTIPVVYKGQTYYIPVSLWIMDCHPFKPPSVFVRPTETMVICTSEHVNARGKVTLPYLQNWKHPGCDLLSLLQILSMEFGERCPVNKLPGCHGARVNSDPNTRETGDARWTVFLTQKPDCDLLSLVQILSLEFGEKCPVLSKVQPPQTKNIGWEYSLQPMLSKEYTHPERVKQEVYNILKTFRDLKTDVSVYATSPSQPQELLRLEGTIPVIYSGNNFNIPICLWIMPTHPAQPPDVYVCPTNTMRISPSDTVDRQGRITLPCLQHWQTAGLELVNVIQILCSTFSKASPVFSLLGWDGVRLAFQDDKRFTRQYQNPTITKTDVLNAVEIFSQLTPKFAWAIGNTYNIPIWIWIREMYPYHPPLVYVRPTPDMVIQVSNHVNIEGGVDLPYLREWKYSGSDLSALIYSLVEVFAKKCPVFARQSHLTAGASSSRAIAFPPTWTEVGSDRIVFPVNPTSEEFSSVVKDFVSSLDAQQKSVSIVNIDRIQIQTLYQQYQIEKETVDRQNPGQMNERNLWHGTTDTAIRNINRYGFNRSYCGKNATVYGQGVYFAVKSSYSACNTYSPPDSQGIKYIYRAKVLTGRYTLGNPSMRDTPLLDPARSVRFHSTANDVKSPAVFASFRDVHSYPEYLIAFRMS